MKEKKQNDVAVLLNYAGKYKVLTFLGMFLSAVAMVMGMVPYICIWLAARDLIAVAPNWTAATEIAKYGWLAFGFAFGGILVYFGALMSTHLAAFRTAANIRKQGVAHLMKTPLGFFDNYASGFLRNRLDGGAAAKAANCDEFVEKLPNGYLTPIGENGAKLSGGERQRISIARALLKNAPIVLLDEATASLDVENETKVQSALSRLLAGKTVLVIAHRMRTVEEADKIVVLKDGTVVEEGSPSDLLAKEDSVFRRMAQLQSASAKWSI